MRVKFSIAPDNTVTIINEDQPDTYVKVETDGDDKVVTVSAVWSEHDIPLYRTEPDPNAFIEEEMQI